MTRSDRTELFQRHHPSQFNIQVSSKPPMVPSTTSKEHGCGVTTLAMAFKTSTLKTISIDSWLQQCHTNRYGYQ
ncbi:hypothetical protein TNCV_1571791 [Trichonephila clavipes]|uniref:Uncharacterized protein n=1 Tax=Trichonephila clavipes TaxID=2585209 RepID=A0A8X6VNT7_TRICX|nr:hypothetical protein TNCV_1571791 [Trichonephila clavipes]